MTDNSPRTWRIAPQQSRLDAAATPGFKAEMEATFPPGAERLLLDLSNVEFVDSTGLGALVAVLKQMGKTGRIAVVGANPQITRLFQITRLDSLFNLCASEADALDVLAR